MSRQTSLAAHGNRDHAWAIELKTRAEPGPNFAGVYNWILGGQPPCLGGITTALFALRSDARAARKELHQFANRRAVVRKVRVHIEVLPERHNVEKGEGIE
jgi:hypothetical protein